ncbi:uncharacterized protein LOC110460535 [Mizuhopecten yessoensis]|uniref:Tripartite motif-containing protein 2 n=1 Tax=Mizuhopecten yessoensis TaxID=6573 RepID=A0A210Q287_MIZYE|nr:uncharacterized protein LOC110460535 [Mizuhopecten yessoensis]OWF42850.1 hypothetical protein KP79_PYT24529 [Mizuhopecten yessoensis]
MARRFTMPPPPSGTFDTNYPPVEKSHDKQPNITKYGKTNLGDLQYDTVFGKKRKSRKPKEIDPSVVITDNGKVHLNRINYDYLFKDQVHNKGEVKQKSFGRVPYYGQAHIIASFKTSRKLGEISKIWPISGDRAWVNSYGDTYLTLIDKKGNRLTMTQDFGHRIWDFVINGKSRMLLTVDRSAHIHAISSNGELSVAGHFPGYQPYGICVMMDGNTLVCIRPLVGTKGPARLVTISINGEVLKYFDTRADDTPLFTEPYSVSSISNGKMFVRDGASKVVCVDTKGTHLYTWTGQSFDREEDFLPSCLSSDAHGSLIVSSRDANKVYILPIAGKGLRCLLDASHGMEHPLGMGVDAEGHLWVACKGRKIHIVKYLSL